MNNRKGFMFKGEELSLVGMDGKIKIQGRYLENGVVINSRRMNAVGTISASPQRHSTISEMEPLESANRCRCYRLILESQGWARIWTPGTL